MRLVPEFKPSDAERWLTGQRHVGSDVQALCDAEPAILSVIICAIREQKHNRIFTTDSTNNTDESQRSQKVVQGKKKIRVFAPYGTDKLNLEPGAVQLISSIARLLLSCKVVCDQSQRRSNRRRTARLPTLCSIPDAPPDRSIELTYSKLKTRHRDEVDRSAGRLRELYRSVLDQSTKPECSNDFKHYGYRFAENRTVLTCIRRQSLQPCLQTLAIQIELSGTRTSAHPHFGQSILQAGNIHSSGNIRHLLCGRFFGFLNSVVSRRSDQFLH